jgi:hypothetical protein
VTDALPTTTSELTAEWMTGALRDSGTIGADVSVSSIAADPATAGVGFMGEVATVGLTYDGDAGDAPSTLVAKFPTRSPDIRAMMFGTKIYEREHRFYRDLAPLTPIGTPAIYHVTCEPSDADPMDERFLLLMEDLGHLTLGDQLVGVTPDQAEAALVALAAHHARFWGGRDLGQDYLPIINGPLNQAGQGIYHASLPGFMDIFGETLRPEMLAVSEGYGAANPKLLDALAAMPHTLVHFDYRADNLFFGDDGSVVCIDWQAISQGGGAADVGYFMGQNLSVEDRRNHERDLLRAYHAALVAGGVSGYDYDTFFDDYRLALVYGWIIPVMAVGSLDVSSERAMALWQAVIERAQTAVIDHDAGRHVL